MDVHPPLAKLLLTLAGWMAGFDGEFDFKDIGKDYLEPGVPYVAMRLLPAIMGVMTVPMIFLTLKAAGCRSMTAAMGAGMVIFGENPHAERLSSANGSSREWPTYSIAPHFVGFALDRLHCLHCSSLDLLHQSARTRTFQGLRSELVVLARCDWSWSWCYSQREMGRTVHYCVDWKLDYPPIMDSSWR